MKKGDRFDSNQFVKDHRNEFTQRRNTLETNFVVIYKAITIGKRIGIIKEIPNDTIPILCADFCKLETVYYFRNQLCGSNRKNTKSDTNGTKDTYARHLYYFNNWIFRKNLEYTTKVKLDNDTYKKEKMQTTLKGVGSFLRIYSKNHFGKKLFEKLIRGYFLEPYIQSKNESVRNIVFFVINEYFKKNDEPIGLTFDPNPRVQLDNDNSEQIMRLDEFLRIPTIGKPSLTERAVFLCKFQRGLDSTLVDRFNLEVWSKSVESFGTEDYKMGFKKCPIIIELKRVKTKCISLWILGSGRSFCRNRLISITGKKLLAKK